jgi:signal peptidase I
MVFDFSFILVAATALTGLIWGLDSLLFKSKRVASARARGVAPENVREPLLVEYARSFFPVILIVLVIRSFLFEPFRIPSDSMMPTLLDGDFIFVNKFAYGLRLPVINTKVVSIGEPKRGDVIVFRLPAEPSTNYIKRLVGLPGDHVVVRNREVFVNGERMPVRMDGVYEGHRHTGARIPARASASNSSERSSIGCCTCTSASRKTSTRSFRPATTSSWATTATTAGTAASSKSASSRSATSSAKRSGSGSTGTCRPHRSGSGSATRSTSGWRLAVGG